jgi:uncharacterized membrane protein
MSDLVVIAYNDEYRAAEVMATLHRLQSQLAIDMEDAVYVTKAADGKVALHQSANLTAGGAIKGGFLGGLVGLLFFAPVVGVAIGAASGAIASKFGDLGVDDKFAKELADEMQPGSSAIFVLMCRVAPDKVVPEISKYGGRVLQTSLSEESERKLQAALQQAA